MHLTKPWKITSIVLISIAVLAAAVLTTHFLLSRSASSVPKQTVSLYFLDSNGANFSVENRSIEVSAAVDAKDQAFLSLLVNELLAGPKDAVVNKRAIPADTKLLSLQLADRIATVDFSGAFYADTDLENNLAVCSVVLTLCETERVDKVAVRVDGKEIIGKGKVPLGALGREDIIDASKPSEAATQKSIVLYYPDQQAQYLVKEQRALQADSNKTDAALVLNELIKGTTLQGGVNVIPASTKVLSCETKEDVCYVNLSKDFIDKRPQGSAAETMVIYSIVDTLTELEGVKKVMFLIEGEKVETYGQMVFNEPFERNVSVLKP